MLLLLFALFARPVAGLDGPEREQADLRGRQELGPDGVRIVDFGAATSVGRRWSSRPSRSTPKIIEKLYLNKNTRMSTADRILELAVRNQVDCPGILAFEQAKKPSKAIIAQPSEEPSFDDVQFKDAHPCRSRDRRRACPRRRRGPSPSRCSASSRTRSNGEQA